MNHLIIIIILLTKLEKGYDHKLKKIIKILVCLELRKSKKFLISKKTI
jgi:hypothetical protein